MAGGDKGLVWGHLDGSSPSRFVWALLPVVPTLFIVRAVLRHVDRVDDYQRLLLLKGLGVGFAVAMVAAVTVGFLGAAGMGSARRRVDHLRRRHARLARCLVGGAEAVLNDLKALREERGWSQGALADRLDVSRQTVNALENDRYDPSLPLAFRIARLFGEPVEAIFFEPDAGGDSATEGRSGGRRDQ